MALCARRMLCTESSATQTITTPVVLHSGLMAKMMLFVGQNDRKTAMALMSLCHGRRSPLIHNEHGGIVTIHYIYCYVIGAQTPHHFVRPYFPCHLK